MKIALWCDVITNDVICLNHGTGGGQDDCACLPYFAPLLPDVSGERRWERR